MENSPYVTAASTTSLDSGRATLTTVPWPTDTGPHWPPYFCPRCWAMRHYQNTRMAQCFYCGHIIMNWGLRNDTRTVASSDDRHQLPDRER